MTIINVKAIRIFMAIRMKNVPKWPTCYLHKMPHHLWESAPSSTKISSCCSRNREYRIKRSYAGAVVPWLATHQQKMVSPPVGPMKNVFHEVDRNRDIPDYVFA